MNDTPENSARPYDEIKDMARELSMRLRDVTNEWLKQHTEVLASDALVAMILSQADLLFRTVDSQCEGKSTEVRNGMLAMSISCFAKMVAGIAELNPSEEKPPLN